MEAFKNKKYFISSSLRRRYNYLIGTLNDEQIYTPYKDPHRKFNVINLKDFKQKEQLIKTLNLIDLDKEYNSEDIKVSVIMPTYNQAKFITKAVTDILKQDHKNLELIIVNDGSTDNTLDIINKLKETDGRIIVIDKQNGGTGSGINAALKVATGKYCTWVSSDNEYFKNYISTLTDILESNPDIDYAFSAFEWYNVANGNSAILNGFSGQQLSEGKYNKSFIKLGYDSGLCFLYRMDLLNKLFFYPEQQGEDYIFLALAGSVGAEFYNTKQILGRYNNHDATLSNVKPQETHKAEAIAKQIASKY